MKNKRFKTKYKDFDLYKYPAFWETVYHYQTKVKDGFLALDETQRNEYKIEAKKVIKKTSINSWLTATNRLSDMVGIQENPVEELSLTSSLKGVLGIRHLTHLLFLSVDESIIKDFFWIKMINEQVWMYDWQKEAQAYLNDSDDNVHTGIHNAQYIIEEMLDKDTKKANYNEIKIVLETSLAYLTKTRRSIDSFFNHTLGGPVKQRNTIGGFVHILSSTFLLLKTDAEKVRSDF